MHIPETSEGDGALLEQKALWHAPLRAKRPEITEGFEMPGFAGRYYMWPEEYALLRKYVELTQGDYLEIGSMCGLIAMSFAQKHPGRHFVCVDLFEEGLGTIAGQKETFMQNLRKHALHNVTLIEGNSLVEVPKLSRKFDVAFIDGNHAYDYVLGDALNCYQTLRKGGYLLFHDYQCVQETTQAVHDFVQATDACLVEMASSVVVACKPASNVSEEINPWKRRADDLQRELTLRLEENAVLRRTLSLMEDSKGWRLLNRYRQFKRWLSGAGKNSTV